MDCDLESLRGGDEQAWHAFFKQYDGLLTSIAGWPKWRFMRHEIEEVVQEIRTHLPKGIRSFKGDSSIEYFIKRVAMHVCVDRVRQNVRRDSRYVLMSPLAEEEGRDGWDPPADASFDPVAEILEAERAARVRALVDALDETCRTAIRFFYLDQLTYREMAERLGIAVNTVGSRLAKCLDKLRAAAADAIPDREGKI